MYLEAANLRIAEAIHSTGLAAYLMPAPPGASPPFAIYHPLSLRVHQGHAHALYRVAVVGRDNESDLYPLARDVMRAVTGAGSAGGRLVTAWPSEEIRLVEEADGARWIYVGYLFRVVIT